VDRSRSKTVMRTQSVSDVWVPGALRFFPPWAAAKVKNVNEGNNKALLSGYSQHGCRQCSLWRRHIGTLMLFILSFVSSKVAHCTKKYFFLVSGK
jgi:hypothetical protein